MSIQGYFLAVLLLLLTGTTPLTAQRHTTSLFFTGNLIFNNNEEQRVGDYGITFGNPNFGLSAELTRRYYGRERLSLETGLQLSTRNFKTIAFDRRDATLPGRITEGYPLSLSVPLRLFMGKAARFRTDLNQSNGLYIGTLLRYSVQRRGDTRGIQHALYREAVPLVSPFLLIGARKTGRLLGLNFELMAPVRGFRRRFDHGGRELAFRWWEVFFSVGVGHTL